MKNKHWDDFPLYDPRNEHDACGMGFIVNVQGEKSHDIITQGIRILINLTHRGACGCDPETGDGAGVTIQIPHEFFLRECKRLRIFASPPWRIWRGHGLPPGRTAAAPAVRRDHRADRAGRRAYGDRLARYADRLPMPSAASRAPRSRTSSRSSSAARPDMTQDAARAQAVRRPQADRIRDRASPTSRTRNSSTSRRCRPGPSCTRGCCSRRRSSGSIRNSPIPDTTSALCLVHQRFSTNTLPNWQLAHPFRYICHNGEINTLRGNVNWMHARQSVLKSGLVRRRHSTSSFPIVQPGGSDSSSLDNAVELLCIWRAAACRMRWRC